MREIEILAPAGSMEGLLAAVKAGADAVYVGGTQFGARAFANNLNNDSMIEAIELAHRYGKKVYLTTNTLVMNREFQSLYEMVAPFYEKGLDACIVQDLGVMSFLHRHFPDMDLHASTQMTVQRGMSGNLLKELGVTRIVPARELSIQGIADCRKETDLELEVFVHGALCYCYSGQCLMSSLIGGRSGNRGMCAQPCRLPYSYECKGQQEDYLISPKDVCTLEKIPELCEAGIDSFKIEGRMKSKEYAVYTSLLYRKYVDFYQSEGKEEFVKQCKTKNSALHRDVVHAMDLFNRGGFCKGYLFEKNKKDVVYTKKNGDYGVLVGTVKRRKGASCEIELLKDVNPQDVLEIRDKKEESIYEFTLGEGAEKKQTIRTNIFKDSRVAVAQNVFRRRNNQLVHEIEELIPEKIQLFAKVTAKEGCPLEMAVCGQGTEAIVTGIICELASKKPVLSEDIIKRIRKTGGTDYEFSSVEVDLEGDLFIPLGAVNELRRQAIEEWEKEFQKKFERKTANTYDPCHESLQDERSDGRESDCVEMSMAKVCTKEQLEICLQAEKLSAIALPIDKFSVDEIKATLNQGKEIFIFAPVAESNRWEKEFLAYAEMEDVSFLINSYEMLALVRKLKGEGKKTGTCIADANLYVANSEAFSVMKDKFNITDFTECMDEAVESPDSGIGVVYGRVPVMITKGCVFATKNQCQKNASHKEPLVIRNNKGDEYLIVPECKYCYNTIYTKKAVERTARGKVRFDFTIESKQEVRKVLEEWNQF